MSIFYFIFNIIWEIRKGFIMFNKIILLILISTYSFGLTVVYECKSHQSFNYGVDNNKKIEKDKYTYDFTDKKSNVSFTFTDSMLITNYKDNKDDNISNEKIYDFKRFFIEHEDPNVKHGAIYTFKVNTAVELTDTAYYVFNPNNNTVQRFIGGLLNIFDRYYDCKENEMK